MKRLLAFIFVVLLLAGCEKSGSNLDRALLLRTQILNGNGCSFTALITADYGDKIHSFTMQCQTDPTNNMTFTVMKPTTIAGITGQISEAGGKLTFDDNALMFETLTDEQITPVAAPWILMRTLRSGYIKAAGSYQDGVQIQLNDSYKEKVLSLDVWTNNEGIPANAEIVWNGKRIMSLTIEDFKIL